MAELVVRLVAGVNALFGITLVFASVKCLVDEAPGTVLAWIVAVVGGGLVAAMVIVGLRLSLGEDFRPSWAAVLLAATLMGGLTGAFWIQLLCADFR